MTEQQETMFEEPADELPSYEEEIAYAAEEPDPTEFLVEAESSVEAMQAYEPAPEPAAAHSEAAATGEPIQDKQILAEPVSAPMPILTADDFAALEERVLKAVSLVRREREARAAAEERASIAEERSTAGEERIRLLEGRVAVLQLEAFGVEQLKAEIESLRAEREQVRQRVERLLVQLDALEF